jgi:hypothetical protein
MITGGLDDPVYSLPFGDCGVYGNDPGVVVAVAGAVAVAIVMAGDVYSRYVGVVVGREIGGSVVTVVAGTVVVGAIGAIGEDDAVVGTIVAVTTRIGAWVVVTGRIVRMAMGEDAEDAEDAVVL